MKHRVFWTVLIATLIGSLNLFAQEPSLAEGRAQIRAGKLAEAEKTFRALTVKKPEDRVAWSLLAYSVHAQGRFADALPLHQKAATFPQRRGASLYNAACCLSRLQRNKEALASLKAARDAGFSDRDRALNDKDLAGVRRHPDFAAHLPPLLEKSAAFVEQPRVLFEWHGKAAGDQFGWVARRVGDLDADGVQDFVSTAPTANKGAGAVYAYSSKTGKELFSLQGKPGERFGNSVDGIGDLDGDGVPDFMVGAPGHSRIAGSAYLVSGKSGKVLKRLSEAEVGDGFGTKVCGLGDINGDGVPDVICGAIRADTKALKDCGRCYAYSGADGKKIFTLNGEGPNENFGSAMEAHEKAVSVRDKKGEVTSVRLLVIGAPNAGAKQQGRAYVYDLTKGGARERFRIEARPKSQTLGMYFVCLPGDVDADGFPDVYASDFGHDRSRGRVVMVSGIDGRVIHDIAGQSPGEGFGTSPSDAGDVNADGHADFIVGAWQNREAARSGGKCYLIDGKSGGVLGTYTSRQAGDTLGFDAIGLGDVDGDGGIDFLLTSAWSAIDGPKQGRVFIVAGPKEFPRKSK